MTLDAWSERLDSMEREGEEENGIDAIFISNLEKGVGHNIPSCFANPPPTHPHPLFFLFFSCSPTMSNQPITFKVATNIMLVAGNTYGWENVALLALILEKSFPPWTFPETRLLDPTVDKLDPFVPNHFDDYFPELSATKVPFVDVLGDGNCLDNSTLHVLEKNWERAFEFRVRKGLHFLGNLATYRPQMEGYFQFEEELVKHCRLYFENYKYQAEEHDAAAAYLTNRPIVIHYPNVQIFDLVLTTTICKSFFLFLFLQVKQRDYFQFIIYPAFSNKHTLRSEIPIHKAFTCCGETGWSQTSYRPNHFVPLIASDNEQRSQLPIPPRVLIKLGDGQPRTWESLTTKERGIAENLLVFYLAAGTLSSFLLGKRFPTSGLPCS